MSGRKWKEVGGLVVIGLAAMVLWDHQVLWPFKILIVLFHELGHALAALATGGEVVSIELSPRQGGVTYTRGGLRFFVLSAGYLGSLVFGIFWLFLGRTEKTARVGVWILAAILVSATLVWLRPLLSFGFGFTLLASGVAVGIARFAKPWVSQGILKSLGVFSTLYGMWDIRDDVLARSLAESDASKLAELTHIPGPVWGVFWLGLGVATLVVLRKWIL